jgi:hypothetical protein
MRVLALLVAYASAAKFEIIPRLKWGSNDAFVRMEKNQPTILTGSSLLGGLTEKWSEEYLVS